MKVTLTYRDHYTGETKTEWTTLVTKKKLFVMGTKVTVELPDDEDMVYFEDEQGLFVVMKDDIIEMKTDLLPPSLN